MTNLQAQARALVEDSRGLVLLDAADRGHRSAADTAARAEQPCIDDVAELVATTSTLTSAVRAIVLPPAVFSTGVGEQTLARLSEAGLAIGVRGDAGMSALPNFDDELVTEGLDGLGERLAGYVSRGADFAAWRSLLVTGRDRPSNTCVHDNGQSLARFAATAQRAGLLPVVAMEVSRESDHDVEKAYEVLGSALRTTFRELVAHRVDLKALLLETSFVTAGRASSEQAPPDYVAWATSRCLLDAVHVAVPGVYFVVDQRDARLTTDQLRAVQALGPHPWRLSFSFGDSAREVVAEAWRGGGRGAARKALIEWARTLGAAFVETVPSSPAPEESDVDGPKERRR